jgi:hypothetical protein
MEFSNDDQEEMIILGKESMLFQEENDGMRFESTISGLEELGSSGYKTV